ncbi:transglycosylase SLT domain-containing protein [Candidatus Albibeggiatoa sp. nov. NOAA]|uniref:transglycosylase SLT domain-containing protein n=1 Tax=Candidatus Albibeggiatoa sp. nov. NOAA TaxID=3162724 RepID=UPI0032FBD78B|nr:transglycosylase SLT domain-containing protein [Thiotrichaceae bacterium]
MQFIILILLGLLSHNLYAASVQQQRTLFLQAHEAYQKKDNDRFLTLSRQLKNYPLHSYLSYLDLKRRFKTASESEMLYFLRRYGDSALGSKLRKDWLHHLAKRKRWSIYLKAYTPQKSTALQCHQLNALLQTNRLKNTDIKQIKTLWLVDKSQPAACDPLFGYLYSNNLVNDGLLWQRIYLVMQSNQVKLAQALGKRLSAGQQGWINLWAQVHYKPLAKLQNFKYADSKMSRDIIVHGLKRIAIQDFKQAVSLWEKFQRRYAFSEHQIGKMQRELAFAGLKKDYDRAFRWLAAVDENYVSESLHEKRLNLALKQQHWQALADFIETLPDSMQNKLQWQYWYARALEQQNQSAKARKIYQKLSKERDYYGFLAADRIGANYHVYHKPTSFTRGEWKKIQQNPNIRRAYEFKKVGMKTNSRRAWNYAVSHLDNKDKAIASALARHWKWYDLGIFTAAKAKAYDDLNVRFPMPYFQNLKNEAKTQNVDLAWVYGIVRQESAFAKDARSHAGAMGLMQLMPATGRLVARKIGLPLRRTKEILELDNNIALGTAYLSQMLDKFDGNYMLATAAYNAGPGRAVRWEKERKCMPVDLWVEMIPFNETRRYVKRVMFYTAIFESRLGRKTTPMRLALDSSECRVKTQLYVEDANPTQKVYVR